MTAAASFPHGVRAIGDLLFVHERQMMSLEVLEPLVPCDRPKRPAPGKFRRMLAPPSRTSTVAGPDAVASPVAGSARCRAPQRRIASWSRVAMARGAASDVSAGLANRPLTSLKRGMFECNFLPPGRIRLVS
jgi:hypothetical protein